MLSDLHWGGARAAPPEDVGGIAGFQRFLASGTMYDDYDEHEDEGREDFDPEHFSRREINMAFREEWHPSPAWWFVGWPETSGQPMRRLRLHSRDRARLCAYWLTDAVAGRAFFPLGFGTA